jgi:hypothetical protein
MNLEPFRTTRPRGNPMARTRKSAYEKLAEKEKEAEQAANEAAALKAQIRDEERRKDTRRKVLAGGAAFSHARIDLVWRETLVAALHKAGTAMKSDRAREEMAALVEYVKGGCQEMDIDARIEEMSRTKPGAAPEAVRAPSASARKPSVASPQG